MKGLPDSSSHKIQGFEAPQGSGMIIMMPRGLSGHGVTGGTRKPWSEVSRNNGNIIWKLNRLAFFKWQYVSDFTIKIPHIISQVVSFHDLIAGTLCHCQSRGSNCGKKILKKLQAGKHNSITARNVNALLHFRHHITKHVLNVKVSHASL